MLNTNPLFLENIQPIISSNELQFSRDARSFKILSITPGAELKRVFEFG